MKKALYFECETGISGDMAVAALIDLGASREKLSKALASLPVGGWRTEITQVKKCGLTMTDFNVVLDNDNHDHDMNYLYGFEKAGLEHHHEHSHDHHHEHLHEHSHGDEQHAHHHGKNEHHDHDAAQHDHHAEHAAHNHHDHHHEHRGLKEIFAILDAGELTDKARELAKKIFFIIADAEAAAHGETKENVHFHEVGAVDSIIDVAAFAVCFDDLGVDEVIVSSLAEGRGSVRCQHGILPVPVPAVVNIAKNCGLTLRVGNMKGELVTPTGAAITAAVKTQDVLPANFKILGVGLGAGKRAYERPSFVRVMLIEEAAAQDAAGNTESDEVVVLETNIDDATGEMLGYALEKIFAAGARDAFYQPIFMKKQRPAYLLTVICDEARRKEIESIIFRETTTIGIRRRTASRSILQREILTVQTRMGEAKVKRVFGHGITRTLPEYDSVAALAKSSGKPFSEVYEVVRSSESGVRSCFN